MAKYFELGEANTQLFEEIWKQTGLSAHMNFKLFGVRTSKQLIKVSRANSLAEELGNCPESIVCEVYEGAFDFLSDENKRLLATDALALVGYDFEKDRIKVEKPQINVTSIGYQKLGEKLLNAAVAGVEAMAMSEQKMEEEKQIARAARIKTN